MIYAIWIIAICEVIRITQNIMQLMMVRHQTKLDTRATDEFIQSLRKSDKEFVRDMLEAYEQQKSEIKNDI